MKETTFPLSVDTTLCFIWFKVWQRGWVHSFYFSVFHQISWFHLSGANWVSPIPPLLLSVILQRMSWATREGALQLYAALHETLQWLYKIVNSQKWEQRNQILPVIALWVLTPQTPIYREIKRYKSSSGTAIVQIGGEIPCAIKYKEFRNKYEW